MVDPDGRNVYHARIDNACPDPVLECEGARRPIARLAHAENADAFGIDIHTREQEIDYRCDHLFPVRTEVEILAKQGVALTGPVEDEAVVAARAGGGPASSPHGHRRPIAAVVEDESGAALSHRGRTEKPTTQGSSFIRDSDDLGRRVEQGHGLLPAGLMTRPRGRQPGRVWRGVEEAACSVEVARSPEVGFARTHPVPAIRRVLA